MDRIDTDTLGNRYDVTPLFADVAAFDALVSDLVQELAEDRPDRVACIDALGFILGAAIARELSVGVIPVRKGGKLPVQTRSETFVDYSGTTKSLELRLDAIQPRDRVLVVDEWIESASQVSAAIRLIEASGGVVSGIAAIHVDDNSKTQLLEEKYVVIAASRLSQR